MRYDANILGGVEMSYTANDINSFSLRSKEMGWHSLWKICFVDIRKMIGEKGINIFLGAINRVPISINACI